MALIHFRLILIQVFISQITASYDQYFQYAGTPYPIPAYVSGYTVQNYAANSPPVYSQSYTQPPSNYQPAANMQQYKSPAVPVGTSTSYAQTGSSFTTPQKPPPTPPSIYQPTAYQAIPYQQPIKTTPVTPPLILDPPKPEPIKTTTCATKKTSPRTNPSLPKDLLSGASPPFDSNVLNNLAIALQLLIVSNLIHNPPPDLNSASQVIDDDIFPEIAPLPIAYIPPSPPELPTFSNQNIPNANFIGTSSFGDTGISKSMMSAYGAPTLPAPRTVGLMSPYDAIGPNSPYVDAFNSKPERKSPYHLSSDYNDLFTLTELFKV